MQIHYITQKGSVYIHQTNVPGGGWIKRDRNGIYLPLAGAIHLTRTRLKELIRDYPASALDTTLCFGNGLAKEFFEDARREHIDELLDGQETHIFFLLNKGEDRYSLGYSSSVQKIEKSETIKTAQKHTDRAAM